MSPMTALINRELIEHRGAFVYAPLILLVTLFVLVLVAMSTGGHSIADLPEAIPAPGVIYKVALGATILVWSGYLMVALFFYYADSFSADRRNNALLFWKSMPQSDFKVLGSKALSGATIFPVLACLYAFISGILIWLVSLYVAARVPIIAPTPPLEALSIWLQMSLAGTLFLFLSVLWYAPFLAWVAGLSTLFQRWSIPLAILVPAVVILLEYLSTLGRVGATRPIADFLSTRFASLIDEEEQYAQMLFTGRGHGFELIPDLLGRVDWVQMVLGWAFALLIVYLASEYRRRRIEA